MKTLLIKLLRAYWISLCPQYEIYFKNDIDLKRKWKPSVTFKVRF